MTLKIAIIGLLATGATHLAGASTLAITDEVTYSGAATTVTSLSSGSGTITPTVSYGIANAYNGAPIGADIPSSLTTGSGGPWNFYDDYTFTVGAGGSNIQSALIAFNTAFNGISDLQARIISVNGTFDPTANLGNPAGGTLVDAWVNTSPAQGINTVNLNQTSFGAGIYDLQIRGEVAGQPATGAYGGSITFTPVPLPAAFPMMLLGLAGFSVIGRRKRQS